MMLALVAALGVMAHDNPELARLAIEEARTKPALRLFLPYSLEGGIVVETPFLRVALQARDAFDRYLPFTEADVNKAFLTPAITISAKDEKVSFKHIVVAVLPPRPANELIRDTAPPTYEEVIRQQKEARKAEQKKSKEQRMVEAAIAKAEANAAIKRGEEARRQIELERQAKAVIIQPTSVEATEHIWQNAYSATFKTTGVKATFPPEVLAPGNEIRAVMSAGGELTVELTPEMVEALR
jgi:hypothetical protein